MTNILFGSLGTARQKQTGCRQLAHCLSKGPSLLNNQFWAKNSNSVGPNVCAPVERDSSSSKFFTSPCISSGIFQTPQKYVFWCTEHHFSWSEVHLKSLKAASRNGISTTLEATIVGPSPLPPEHRGGKFPTEKKVDQTAQQ